MAQVSTSTQFSINWRDTLKAGLTAAIVAFVGASGQVLTAWITTSTFAIDTAQLIIALKIGIAAFIGELGRRFLDSNKIIVSKATTEEVKAIKEGTALVKVQTL